MQMIDILVKNGHIIDPAANIDTVGCIGINNGISLGVVSSDTPALQVIDASGLYVFPGLIDFHTHIFTRGSSIAIDPAHLIPMGVTTTADAGTTGCSNFSSFYSDVIVSSPVTIRTFLNISSFGQPGDGFQEDFNPGTFNTEAIQNLAETYPEQITGIKIRMEEDLLGNRGLAPLIKAKEIAKSISRPLVVHCAKPPVPESEILAFLEKDDVLCHCYHGKNKHTITDENGNVYPEVWEARARGVIFDSANGITNYNHDVAISAIKEGFLPDIISSDLCDGVFNRDGYGKSLPFTMSKYLWFGMSMKDVIRAVTETPARILGLHGKAGTLSNSAWGDLAIFKHIEAKPVFLDNNQKVLVGDQLLIPQLTIKAGKVLFRQTDF